MIYTIEQITQSIQAHRLGQEKTEIAFILTDSRSLTFPENTLFFALVTPRNDGHKYISELYKNGVRNFVVSHHDPSLIQSCPYSNFLIVPDTLDALRKLALEHRNKYHETLIAVTGSNGKTVVKEWLYRLLSRDKVITRSPRSYNSQIGVPLSLWLLDENTELAIIEAGISQPGEMDKLEEIIKPDTVVITHIGTSHQENFDSTDQIYHEKLKLLKHAKTVICSADDINLKRYIDQVAPQIKRITWSLQNETADLYITKTRMDDANTNIEFVYSGQSHTCCVPFIDRGSIENIITCVLTALHQGMQVERVIQSLGRLEPIAMRLEVKQGINDCILINDSYNLDIPSLDIALDFMCRRAQRQKRKKTLIISDLQQTGLSPDELYQKVAKLISERQVQKIIGIGTQIMQASRYFKQEEKYFFETTEAFISDACFKSLSGEDILIKGARRYAFDRITELLVRKVHETILEVDLNAIVDNLNFFRQKISQQTLLACMVKADGYGAGAVEIAKTLQEHRVGYLAVAVADEGVELRKNGITTPIMVMNPEMSAFKNIFDYDLEPEVYSFRLLHAMINAARREAITDYPVHIKIDTGMHRLGFDPETEMGQLIDLLKSQKAVRPKSVFTHFAGSDDQVFDAFSQQQYIKFDQAATRLQQAFRHKILRHVNNSSGIIRFTDRQMDMCRLGLGLYGVNPTDNQVINNVCTLKTTILQIRTVPADETVGYGRKGTLTRKSRIAAIPIGYADGLSRRLGNRVGYCMVNGQKAPYVGNICMDVAMIDVTDIPCNEGDMVVIFGAELPVSTVAEHMQTIPYEVLTGISNRVKRIYFQG